MFYIGLQLDDVVGGATSSSESRLFLVDFVFRIEEPVESLRDDSFHGFA